jgi:excinuclease ABC subunit A
MMEKPDVDHIEGLSPAISIEQKSTSHNPRSTVGTVTEIYDYLRLLFARVGEPRCPTHQLPLNAQTVSQMVDQILSIEENTSLMILAPVVKDRKGEHLQLIETLKAQGFVRARINNEIYELEDAPKLKLHQKHTIEVIVDRFKVRSDLKLRLAESFETALKLGQGIVNVAFMNEPEKPPLVFSANFACPECGYSLTELEPRLFSFNNPAGACPECDGLGIKQFFDSNKVIHNSELSLAEGAVRGWDRKTAWYFQMLESVAQHFKFDLNTPFNKLSDKIQKVILYGSGEVEIALNYYNDRGSAFIQHKPFEGIIPNLERRYRETESVSVREEMGKYISFHPCKSCEGTRLNESARNVFIENITLPQISAMPIAEAKRFIDELNLTGRKAEIASKITKEITTRLQFLVNVGLNYLTLNRSAETLSGGEAQRIRLASQIGAGLVGVMYILDEPSIGLHQRDNQRLLDTLFHLRDLGNTVIVVEHDEEAIRNADQVIDIGIGAGVHGGTVVAQGTPEEIQLVENSLTGQYLSGKQRITIPTERTPFDPEKMLYLFGANGNNLKQVNLEIPIGLFVCITGVSGSGKSTLINDTLYPLAANVLNKASLDIAPFEKVAGLELFDKVVDVDQSPIGRTPRSNPATYTGLFTPIRELFAATQEARSRGYQAGRFSFNVKGGRCEACAGDGVIKVEMHFLPDIYVPCDVCKGQRYNRETLDILFKGKNISDVLKMTVEEAAEFFSAIPTIKRKLDTLMEVGLSYITLGQNAVTLSGGEAQRVKLAKELSKRDTGNTLYILDEPTTGLHFHDIAQLLKVLHRLREHGNTVVVIEHNLDVIKTADWIIDLGPEGGEGGGNIIATGTPEMVAEIEHSHTGHYLKKLLV